MSEYMLAEIGLILGAGAMFFATLNAFVIRKYMNHVSDNFSEIYYKLNLIETTMIYHDLLRISYEPEETEDISVQREGNIIYLNKDKEE